MPRYDNEGFNPNRRIDNDRRNRSVPKGENYYSDEYEDIFSHSPQNGDVRDNQRGVNPCNDTPYQYNNYDNLINSFESERPEDFVPQNQSQSPSRTSPSRQNSNKPKRAKKSKGGRGKHHLSVGKKILLVVLAIILLCVGSVFPVLGRIIYDDKKDNEYISSSELKSSPFIKNILFLGVDARSDDEAESSRSDSMMLISIDMKHHTIKMTSFLRDTWVYIPCNDGEQRLNAACTYGGYKGVADTIEYNFGVDIDGYVVADFKMFQILVDSIGGVEIDVTKAEAKEVTNHQVRYGHVTLKSGKQVLTGEQALAYCRIRKIDDDFARTKRQRTVLNSIIKKMKSTNPFSLYKMAYNAAPYIETDLTKGQLIRTVLSAGICAGSDTHQTRIPFKDTWEYANISGNSVISINKEENKEQLIDFIYNKNSAELTSIEAEENK